MAVRPRPVEPAELPDGVVRKSYYEMSIDMSCGDEYFLTWSDGDNSIKIRETEESDSEEKVSLSVEDVVAMSYIFNKFLETNQP